jgi:hypothetical protein
MLTLILQAAVGPDGSWQDWFVIDDMDRREHANRLVDKHPGCWRIVSA